MYLHILRSENGNSFVTNPLTWRTDSVYAPRKLNKGSVLFKFNKVYRQTTDARASNGFLYREKTKIPLEFSLLHEELSCRRYKSILPEYQGKCKTTDQFICQQIDY